MVMMSQSKRNDILQIMRQHSKDWEVTIESFDYGFQLAICVSHPKKGRHTKLLPNKVSCNYEDPEQQMLHLMGIIPSNYRAATYEDAAKIVVEFVKQTVD
jgi:hypothetical protein